VNFIKKIVIDFGKIYMKQVDIILGLKCNEKCGFCFQNTDYIKKHDIPFDKLGVLSVLIKARKA
jgi:biotin synthase-like enzyme